MIGFVLPCFARGNLFRIAGIASNSAQSVLSAERPFRDEKATVSGRMLRQRISLRTPNPWDHDEAAITALKATTLCCRRKIRKAWDVLLHSAPFYSETPLFRDSLLEKNINSASLSISRQRWLTSETTGNEKTSRRSDSEQSSQLLAGAQPSSPAAQQPSSPAAQPVPIDHLFDMRSWHSSRALRLRLRTLRRRPRRRPKDSPGDGLMSWHGTCHKMA